jgi:Zn-dependent protease with chaperone function
MTWWALIVAPWVLSFIAGRCALRLARHARPDTALPVMVVSGVVLAAASVMSLALVAFVGIARTGPVASFADWDGRTPHGAAVPPLWCTIAAVVVLALLIRRVLRRSHAIATATARAVPIQREARSSIVAVGDDAAYAYACRPIPFRAGVIFVSDGLRDALDADEFASVVAHERAHLDRQHGLYQHLGALLAAVDPFLAPLASTIDYCLERAADERAAATTGRATTATALARAALHRTVTHPVVGLAHARGDIAWRVEALLADPPRRVTRTLLIAGFAVLAVVAVAVAAHDTEILIEAVRN